MKNIQTYSSRTHRLPDDAGGMLGMDKPESITRYLHRRAESESRSRLNTNNFKTSEHSIVIVS